MLGSLIKQRQRQQESHKFAYSVGKNNSFARSARTFLFLCRRQQNNVN